MLRAYLSGFNCGEITVRPFVLFNNGKKIEPDYREIVGENKSRICFSACIDGLLKDDFYIEMDKGNIICRRVFQNISDKTLKLKELGLTFDGITFNAPSKDDYFYHTENPRIYGLMTFPIDYNRTKEDAINSDFDIVANNRWADPGVVSERIGAGPYQAFPAVLVSNYCSKKGLVFGTLSQKVFFHNFLTKHIDKKVRIEAFSSFKDIAYLNVKSGRVLVDEWYLGDTDNADDIERIFEEYTTVLRKKLPCNYGATDINRNNLIWCSWNDGVCYDISEEIFLTEAEYLKKYFPKVKWFELDVGYTVCDFESIGAPYAGESAINYKRFPNGLRALSDKLRLKGFSPALWINLCCPVDSKIYKEHPDWFIDYSRRMDTMQPLDISKKPVREYIQKALDVLICEYGFDGIKLDFWSYPFEDSDVLYDCNDASGYEYRNWLIEEFRRRLPKDGYLQSCCDVAASNPFLGESFTNYRYGIDIAHGSWENVKAGFLWGTACFATHTGDMFVPNSDGLGMLSGLNDDEALFFINFCTVTRSFLEIAGKFSKIDKNNKRLKMLQKAVCNPDNGKDVYFVNYDYRKSYTVPDVIYFKTPLFSKSENVKGLPLRTVGLFNIEDFEKEIKFYIEALKLPEGEYLLTDIWTGETFDITESYSVKLRPHESRLFAVSLKNGLQLLDANIEILDFELKENVMEFTAGYGFDAEIQLSRLPSRVLFEGKNIEYKSVENRIFLSVPNKGRLSIFLE